MSIKSIDSHHVRTVQQPQLKSDLIAITGDRVWLGMEPDGGEEMDGYNLRSIMISCKGMDCDSATRSAAPVS